MSSVKTVSNDQIQPISFQTLKRDEKEINELSLDITTQKHFSGLKDALMEVLKSDSEKTQKSVRPAEKNSMITTFKIMKIVTNTLRKTSECQKETNKLIKQEWKSLSEKQSENNKESFENVKGNQWYLLAGQLAGVSYLAGDLAVKFGADRFLARASSALNFNSAAECLRNSAWVKERLSDWKAICPQIASGGNSLAQSMSAGEQYRQSTKGDIFNQEVQTHTSEYQNGAQQENSDKQAVDSAADLAKQLIRVQGEILMGKSV
jgi:hypothetical protein